MQIIFNIKYTISYSISVRSRGPTVSGRTISGSRRSGSGGSAGDSKSSYRGDGEETDFGVGG